MTWSDLLLEHKADIVLLFVLLQTVFKYSVGRENKQALSATTDCSPTSVGNEGFVLFQLYLHPIVKLQNAVHLISLVSSTSPNLLIVRKEAVVASPESDPLLLLAIFQANHQCPCWICLLRVRKVSVFQNPADGNALENSRRAQTFKPSKLKWTFSSILVCLSTFRLWSCTIDYWIQKRRTITEPSTAFQTTFHIHCNFMQFSIQHCL